MHQIYIGCFGPCSEAVQKALNQKIEKNEIPGQAQVLEVDGWLGEKTQQAIIDFQAKNGLNRDGICGVKTLTKLGLVKFGKPEVVFVHFSKTEKIYEGGNSAQIANFHLRAHHGKVVYDQVIEAGKINSLRDYKKADNYNLSGSDEHEKVAVNVVIVQSLDAKPGEMTKEQEKLLNQLLDRIERDFKSIQMVGYERKKPVTKKTTTKKPLTIKSKLTT